MKKRTGSVAGKIVTGAMTLVLVAAATTSMTAIARQTAAMELAEQSGADLLASAVGISSANDIATSNIANLAPTIRRIRESNSELLWIMVKDQDGNVLTRDPETPVAAQNRSAPLISPITIAGQTYGEIHMIFDRTPMEKARREIISTTGAITAALLLVVFLVALVWAKFFARPIVALASASERVAGGDLTVRVDVSRNDEIGQLSDRFNEMVDNLRRSRIDLERTLNELSTLYGVSKIINTTSDRNEILKLNIETLATGFHFSHVLILLQIEHGWYVGAAQTGKDLDKRVSVDPHAIGLRDAIMSEIPVVIDGTNLPKEWGFPADGTKIYATALRTGSHIVGLLLAGGPGAEEGDSEKILSVVASQIAPPILISLMIESEMKRLTNPFEYIRKRLSQILEKANGFGLGVTILTFSLEPELWKEGAVAIEKRFEEIAVGVRSGIAEVELVVRYGTNRLIAVVPSWTKADARSALMSLELPHMDDLEIAITSAPDDGQTAEELLTAVEKS